MSSATSIDSAPKVAAAAPEPRPDPGLRPGLTCDAEIVTSERTNVLTAPLQSVVLRAAPPAGERTGGFLLADGQARFTPVMSGVIGGLDIEVSGIAEGARIIVPLAIGEYLLPATS